MDANKVGKAIAFLRRKKGYTQNKLAEKLGVSDKAVSKWERGLGVPDVSLLAKLSIILDTDIESLLNGDILHNGQQWCGILMLDQEENETIYAGTILHDKPIIHYLLSYFMLVGIKNILIFSALRSYEYIENLCKSENKWGIRIENVLYENTFASEKYINIKNYVANRNVVLIKGYNFIYGTDVTKYMQRAMVKPEVSTILCLLYKVDDQSKRISYDTNLKIVNLDSAEKVESLDEYYTAPMLFISKEVFNKGSFSLYDPVQSLLDPKNFRKAEAELIGRGLIFVKLKNRDDIQNASKVIKFIQDTQRIKIADLVEIAMRRGLL
jgi:glucose-1-phosphate thymidylyltransferase